jgi:hypothetical protein
MVRWTQGALALLATLGFGVQPLRGESLSQRGTGHYQLKRVADAVPAEGGCQGARVFSPPSAVKAAFQAVGLTRLET